jgi:TatD DNase family protein
MKLVDIHCHLNHKNLTNDLDGVLKRAQDNGVQAIIVSGVNTPSNREVLKLAEKSDLIKVSLGLHPIDALGLVDGDGEFGLPRQTIPINLEEEFAFIESKKDEILAIGEIGMDFHWADKEKTLEKQSEIFRKILQLAKKIKKPVIIHAWKGEEECLNILEEEIKGEIPVVLHCFGGRKSLISRAKDLGYYFSVPPSILKASNFQTLVKKVDIKQLLTETDAPWQSPFKDKQSEPAYVLETVKKIAEIKKLTVEEVADIIWNNYQKVFIHQ